MFVIEKVRVFNHPTLKNLISVTKKKKQTKKKQPLLTYVYSSLELWKVQLGLEFLKQNEAVA